MDRRAAFFLLASAISLALIPVAEPPDRWVPITVAVAYVVLAAASIADARSRARTPPRRGHRDLRE